MGGDREADHGTDRKLDKEPLERHQKEAEFEAKEQTDRRPVQAESRDKAPILNPPKLHPKQSPQRHQKRRRLY